MRQETLWTKCSGTYKADDMCMPAQERNMHNMKLVEGEGNAYDSSRKALEGDRFNTVFIVVSVPRLLLLHCPVSPDAQSSGHTCLVPAVLFRQLASERGAFHGGCYHAT